MGIIPPSKENIAVFNQNKHGRQWKKTRKEFYPKNSFFVVKMSILKQDYVDAFFLTLKKAVESFMMSKFMIEKQEPLMDSFMLKIMATQSKLSSRC
jgi:hypothetical protein